MKQSDYSFLYFMLKGNYDNSSCTTLKIATCYSLSVWLVSLTNTLLADISWSDSSLTGQQLVHCGFCLISPSNLVRWRTQIQSLSQQKQHSHSENVWTNQGNQRFSSLFFYFLSVLGTVGTIQLSGGWITWHDVIISSLQNKIFRMFSN